MSAKGEEMSEYKGLDPTKRLLILKALCEIRADQDDAVAYINDSLKQGTQISYFRKEKIGGDGNGTSFWYEGNTMIGHRLYKGVSTFLNNTKSQGRECLDPPCFQWETLATNLEEFRKVANEFSSSNVVAEAAVGRIVEADAILVLEKIQKNKERAMKRKQKREMVLNDCRSSVARVTRPCRNRRPVNYTYEDYDRAIFEAIRRTKKGTKHDEQGEEIEDIKTGGRNAVGTERTDRSPKRDCSRDDKKNDDIDIDMVQEVGSDDDYDYSGKDDVDDSDFCDSGKPEVDGKNKQAGSAAPRHFGIRWSQRLGPGTGQSFVENGNLGTKNRSRQRPMRNSALDAVVVPDSEDDS